MAINTYGTLKTAAANWAKPNTTLATAETTDRIPEYIALAQAELTRRLAKEKVRQMDQLSASLTITAGVATVPTGFLGVKSFRQNASGFNRITYQPIDYIEALDPSATGEPRHYDQVGSTLVTWPASTTTGRLRYTKGLTAFSVDADTDWLLTAYPDIYLLGTLLESDYRLDLEEMRPKWSSAFERKIDQLFQLNMNMPDAFIPLPNGAVA